MRPVHRTLVLVQLAAVAVGPVARRTLAQTPNIRVAGRLQTQFSTVSGDSTSAFNPNGTVTSAFEVRRLRIQADVRIGENVNAVLMPSFEMGALRMRDAFVRVVVAQRPGFALGVTVGQEKKPFNRYELITSNTLPSIERGGRFRGLTEAITQNDVLTANGYIAHDLGANADVSLREGRVVLKAGFYNGSGESAVDVNNGKTFALRATATVIQDEEARPVLRVGAAVIDRDRAVCATAVATCPSFAPDSSHRSRAFGLEAEWGDFRPGLHVLAEFATGDNIANAALRSGAGRNTGNLRPGVADTAFTTFRSVQIVASWRWQPADPAGTRLIKILEPALRLDATDPNSSVNGDGAVLITPVLNVHLSQTTVVRAGLDLYRYRDAAGATQSLRAFRVSWQTNF